MRVPRRAQAAVSALLLAAALVPAGQAAPWSDTFTVAEPRAGDSGLYSPGSIVVGDETVDSDGLGFAFELGNRTTVEDAYGVERDAWPFRSYATAEGEAIRLPISTWIHARAQAPLVREAHLPGIVAGGFSGEGGSETVFREETFGSRHEDPYGPECLFLTGVQGATLQEGARLPLADVCGQDLAELADEENATVEIRVAEVVTLENGGEAVRLVLQAEQELGSLEADLWYKEAIPYPVEINLVFKIGQTPSPPSPNTPSQPGPVQLSLLRELAPLLGGHADAEPSEGFTVNASIELERFHRGQGTVVPGGQGPGWPAYHEDLSLHEDTRWGPRDGGPSLAYPHDEAVEAILGDPTLVEFQDWWSDHPEARALVATYEEKVASGEHRSTWTFLLAAPDGSGWEVTSTRSEGAQAGEEPRLDLPPTASRNDAERVDLDPQNLDLASVPDRLPSLSSLVDVWGQRDPETHRDHDANRFRWVHQAVGPWSDEEPRLEVGWRDPDGGSSPTDPGWSVNESLLRLHPSDGAALELDRQQASMGDAWLGGAAGGSVGWPGMAFQGAGEPAAMDAPAVVGIATASTLLLIALVLAKLGVSVPLYSRLDREDLLDQPTRRAVYDVLGEEEGLPLETIADEAECSPSTARYHLNRLEEGGLVAAAGTQAGQRWFATGSLSPEEMQRRAALEVGHSRKVYDHLVDEPGASLSEVADAIGSSPPAVHQIVDRLVDAGIVEKRRDGREVALYPADGSLAVSAGEPDA